MSSESEYDTVLITYISFYSIFSHTLPNITQTSILSVRLDFFASVTNPVIKPMRFLSGDINN